jgi:hypothetical protein
VESIVRDIVFMMIGMGAGMLTFPFMMKRVKEWKTDRKVERMLREIDLSSRQGMHHPAVQGQETQ